MEVEEDGSPDQTVFLFRGLWRAGADEHEEGKETLLVLLGGQTMIETTALTTFTGDLGEALTGDERYPIVGEAATPEEVEAILKSFEGLNPYWDCIEKAKRAVRILGRGRVVLGAMMIASADMSSTYGHYFNPPFEFHAWVDLGNGIVFDAALPGTIIKGTNTSDDIGPMLVGREPIVLAGRPREWMF
jgi:hypothetical protein